MPITLDDILTAYRAMKDTQRIEAIACNRADLGAGCYDPAMFPAWQQAQADVKTAHKRLFTLLDEAAYPEKQSPEPMPEQAPMWEDQYE